MENHLSTPCSGLSANKSRPPSLPKRLILQQGETETCLKHFTRGAHPVRVDGEVLSLLRVCSVSSQMRSSPYEPNSEMEEMK
jgi:hypothetical protein